MNDLEKKARLRNLDQLSKEMDRYEADSFRSRGKASEPVAANDNNSGESGSPALTPVGKDDKPFYQDPDREKVLDAVEARADTDQKEVFRPRGQFGKSRA